MKAHVLFASACAMTLLFVFGPKVYADQIRSDQYVITDPSLDIDPQSAEDRSVKNTYSLFKSKDEQLTFENKGYLIRSIEGSLESAVDNANIQFVTDGMENRLKSTTQITLIHPTGRRAATTIGQVEPLKSLSGSTIDATRCDRVMAPCTRSYATPWKSSTAWGVGYTMNDGLYKTFPRIYQHESEEIVLLKDRVENTKSGKMTIKVLKSKTDTTETYQSVLRMTTSLMY